MEALAIKNKEYDDTFCTCPICNHIEEYDYQYEDYVFHAMIWCSECGARCVVCPTNLSPMNELLDDQIININEVPDDHPQKISINFFIKKSQLDINDYNFYRVKFAKISKVMDCRLDEYKSATVVDQNELCEFIESNYDPTLMAKFGYERSNIIQNESIITDFNIGLNVGSYDVEDPLIPYPNNFSPDHDGIVVHLECIDSNGKIFYSYYSGD